MRMGMVAAALSALCALVIPQGQIRAQQAGAAASAPEPRDFGGVWLPDGKRSTRMPRTLPYTPAAKKFVDDYEAVHLPIDVDLDDAHVSCVPEFFPYVAVLFATYPFEFVMGEKQVTVLAEMFGYVRRIHLDGGGPPAELLPSTLGYSRGRWDGNTLVVETTHVQTTGAGPFGGYPPASRARRYIERLTLVLEANGQKTLENRMTVIDPAVFTRPVDMLLNYRWSPDIEVGEYLCQQDLWDQNIDGNPSSVPWRH